MGGSRTLGAGPLPGESEATCTFCRGPLYLLSDAYPLAFLCEYGHFLTLTDLLEGMLVREEMPRESALKWWEGKAALLHALAAGALQHGHPFTAADLEEGAHRIEDWASMVGELLGNPSAEARTSERDSKDVAHLS